jgi:hypothetical protein
MSGLANFRQQHPQYNDMSDAALADALHAKFYADIPKDQYLRSLGLAAAAPQAPARPAGVRQTNPNTVMGLDMAGAVAGGLTGAKGGAVLGAPFGPVGSAVGALGGALTGAALGLGITREGQQVVDRITGAAGPETLPDMAGRVGGNLQEGAIAEGIGRGAVPILSRVVGAGARAAGALADLPNMAAVRASRVLTEAAGDRLPAIRETLRAVPEGQTLPQALAPARAPAVQALMDRGLQRTPASVNYLADVLGRQADTVENALATLAQGTTQTQARVAQQAGKRALNDRLIPTLRTELDAANTAGRLGPPMADEAARLRGAAAGSVEDVRRFTAAGNRASAAQQGLPGAPQGFTYPENLVDKAREVAEQAARGSLNFGEAARFREYGLQSLAAHGLRPLQTAPLIGRIQAKLTDPATMPGNTPLKTALSRVADDIREWTNNRGIIDAAALDAIRKNSVNAVVMDLTKGAANDKAGRRLAADITAKVNPLIVDAIEEAGGTGYRQYLKSYAEGMRQLNERKLGAEALKLYKTSPERFADLVDGDAPKLVEKIFGPGRFDIEAEVSPSAMKVMRDAAQVVRRSKSAAEQAAEGQTALQMVMEDAAVLPRLVNTLSRPLAVTNAALAKAENRLGKAVLRKLTAASMDNKTMLEVLDTLPAAERARVLRVLSEPLTPAMRRAANAAMTGASVNMLAPEPINHLAPQ